MKYITIDGDDIGRKITSYYLSNKSEDLSELSSALKLSTEQIASKLKEMDFNILFCAADGVVASTDCVQNFDNIFKSIREFAPNKVTFSAGVGNSLREAYVALVSAKSNGKNCWHMYSRLDSGMIEK